MKIDTKIYVIALLILTLKIIFDENRIGDDTFSIFYGKWHQGDKKAYYPKLILKSRILIVS